MKEWYKIYHQDYKHIFLHWFLFLFVSFTFSQILIDQANSSFLYTEVSASVGNWIAPIGVPNPSFGLSEFPPPAPTGWSDTSYISQGYIFYFVCSQCAGATDQNNPYGYPQKARVTIPATVNGPAVVVLYGQIDAPISFVSNGTATAPVFVTSGNKNDMAKLTDFVSVKGSYVIFDHLKFMPFDANDGSFGFHLDEGVHHVALRNSEIVGNKNRVIGVSIGNWGYTGTASATDIVIDNNYIHDIGDVTSTLDQDAHCIVVNGSVNHAWVTYNKFDYCSGDSIQIEAQANRRDYINNIFFGKNISNGNRQSGGWIKNARDVVFSQNIAHDIRQNSGGPGSCYGMQYDADYVWFLFNEAYHCNIGINIASYENTPGTYAFVVGNIIHDIDSQNPTDVYNAGAMVIRGSTNVYVLNNTIDNVASGVNMPPGTKNIYYYNNILSNRTRSDTYDLYSEGGGNIVVKNSMFGVNPRFNNVSVDSTSFAAPDFGYIDLANRNYRLSSASPAINKGALLSYTFYSDRYGVSITFDADGNMLPQGSSFDIGAYEYVGVPSTSSTQTTTSTTTTTTTSTSTVNTATTTTTTSTSTSTSATTSPSTATSTSSGTPSTNNKFTTGNRVYVSTNKLNVRKDPGGKNLGFQRINSMGTVVSGPVYFNGSNWWNINYDNSPDGWSVENYLQIVK